MPQRSTIASALLLTLALTANIAAAEESHAGHNHGDAVAADAPAQLWTCSMHPQIKVNRPGQCPICKMDLIPLKTSDSKKTDENKTNDDPVITLSKRAEKLAEVVTARAVKMSVPQEIELTGRITYDESALARVAMRFSGRVEQLYVNYTGITVRKGDHIAEVFSPDLIVMQREYLQELNAPKTPALESTTIKSLQVNALDAVKSKMRLWGFSPAQIAAIGEKNKISEDLTILAPIDGTVIDKNIVVGQYFDKEQNLFTIADLSKLWLVLDVYEKDLRYLYYGQEVAFRLDAWPEKTFHGRIAYINPVLNEQTRTVPVRVNLDNHNGEFRPGMYARAEAYALLDQNGKIVDDALAGKWISPMHPEIVKDAPGVCDICGMALVPAESLNISNLHASQVSPQAPLVIPASAPLITGRRAVVYVKTGPGRYEGRQVVLGPRAGDYYIIASGLNENDEVVVNGAMKIDSALQISGRRSMTGAENFTPIPEPSAAPAAVPALDVTSLYQNYFTLQQALVNSDAKGAAASIAALRQSVTLLPDSGDGKALKEQLLPLLPADASVKLAEERQILGKISPVLITWAKRLELKKQQGNLHFYHCPMALDGKGGDWLQNSDSLANPYFGSAMLHCGSEKQ